MTTAEAKATTVLRITPMLMVPSLLCYYHGHAPDIHIQDSSHVSKLDLTGA
jgi:hypothetical protein